MDKYSHILQRPAPIDGATIEKQILAKKLAASAETTRKETLKIKLILKGLGKATYSSAQWNKVFARVQAVKADTKEFGASLEWFHVTARRKVRLCTMPAAPKLDRQAGVDAEGNDVLNYVITWPML